MTKNVELDKSIGSSIDEGYGTITVRVVVLQKGLAPAAAPTDLDESPIDTTPDEVLPDSDKRPTSTFMEEPKRGRQCCVFLINGQRQHGWDNQFIVRDLEMKYLRNRMIVIVDCDGLKPEAIAQLMQGSRFQFFEGIVYFALESRVIAILKGDPDLRKLEEEAEDDISSLQAGDEVVKATLDQLIEAHHDESDHSVHGHSGPGSETRESNPEGQLAQTADAVVEDDPSKGLLGTDPVLLLQPDLATIRIKPNEIRECTIYPRPDTAWKSLETMALTFDPPVKELQVTRITQLVGEKLALKFVQPDDFDPDEYPVETTLRCTAIFKGHPEPRILEKRILVTPSKTSPPPSPVVLKDDPTYLKVTSRQPIKIVVPGPDVHVKLRWDGKDELVNTSPPVWTFQVSCESPSVEPQSFLTRPQDGRFELLIHASPGLNYGEQLKFTIDAMGPGKTFTTAFLVDVVEPKTPRKISTKLAGGAQRKPPYQLLYVKKENWKDETCWNQQPWTSSDAGSFDPPTPKTPLTIFINQDMELLEIYRNMLVSNKLAETTIQQRINKYTAHVAFHLYQMYLKQKDSEFQPEGESTSPREEQMREEIQRVARTLIKLMEVSQ